MPSALFRSTTSPGARRASWSELRPLVLGLGLCAGFVLPPATSAEAQAPAKSPKPVTGKPVTGNSAKPAAATLKRDTTPVTMMVFEEDVVMLALEPDERLGDAREALRANDKALAATKTHQAAAFVRIASGGATDANRADLRTTAHDLNRLADDIAAGRVSTVAAFDAELTGTNHALAAHHLTRAKAAWAKREERKAGHELKAATSYLDRGAKAAGKETVVGTEDAVREGRKVSAALVRGTGWTTDEVGKGIAAVGSGVERLGRDVAGKKKAPPSPRD